MKNYYELLSVDPSAPASEIKRAFRQEIARYHPDKVHHLGKEFQEIAAVRAAELTEAYRVLTNAELRAEYDRQLSLAPASPSTVQFVDHQRPAAPPRKAAVEPSSSSDPSSVPRRSSLFAEERNTKDEYVRKATLSRIRKIVKDELGSISEVPVRGFDLVFASAVRSSLFGKRQVVPNFFVRLVRDVNGAAIRETWAMARKVKGTEAGEACVALLGPFSSAREVAEAVSVLKQRSSRSSGPGSLLLVPVDIRDWSAQIPEDAPKICKVILQKLVTGG